ncbi:ntp phosphatase : Non-canonical purine NTP pyrophosphatase OS=Planctomyces limnophilus (strain ATCC 43296 / DSM 3776 / IFAM 1008 / 290) GN=Plim_2323 PE=3 SV=1: Ham1p_like [Gemmataceae bacterium]|nr:ntp phosphatase : Non-canonical purine NTP pyrophosphatase OS=Planctomyces limnophilus (strain ATCC 43296 / DSM 3776 / IFAM 1008 / 290) GN=Plim_2323 PE=3 SV=1: Ham1p_like [Gemmataceae bacterium]VTU01262.1 ntp phosphatase : Non-canonical purine NTP pyrophosphatase OS=Planctomyces limnophilus (strain ATCC 43296 / DSM 3776 / IFAM 1008 / 290) GN=Plim_2323 PE=3 SV=1: Ham1p_like [Gemmataceae bacterium]
MLRLVLGSRNKKKLGEMVELLADLPVEVTDLTPYPNAPPVEETAGSFVGNATLKATQLAPALGQWVIGEDSGLCVPALGGDPGVDSALYAGTHGDDAANNAKLLREMAHLTGDERAAYYISTAVLSDPTGKVVAQVEGRCHGVIVDALRGAGGFGYDPLFLVPEFGKTFGELPPEVKRAMSHRAMAFQQLRPVIERILAVGG